MPEIFEDYAGDLLREFGGSPDRALSAARVITARQPGVAAPPPEVRPASQSQLRHLQPPY